jgi:hypothetical protein
MAGQSTQMSRDEVIRCSRALEIGPNKTQGGSSNPNVGKEGMNVKVPTKKY